MEMYRHTNQKPMPRTRLATHASNRHRQIGRKVLLADRLNRSLNSSKASKLMSLRRSMSKRPWITAAIALFVLVSIAGIVGVQLFTNRTSVPQQKVVSPEQRKLEAKSREADACRRKKLAEKADQIGTITYDELYDGNSCDK